MKRTLTIIALLSFWILGYSQDQKSLVADTVGVEFSKDTTSLNFQALELQLISDIDWLSKTPLNKDLEVRDDKNRFVFMWMSECPYLYMTINKNVATFIDGEPWIMLAYMMGWTKYYLTNNYSRNEIQLSIAGVRSVVDFYKKNKRFLQKNEAIDKYVRLDNKGQLEGTVSSAILSTSE